MASDELDKVEQPALDQLQRLGWDYIHGKHLSPEGADEREYYTDVVLVKRLEASILRLNPWINLENLRKVVRLIAKPQLGSLIETNQALWQSLTQYLSVEQDLGKGRRGQTVKVIDFETPENNEYLCTNQFKVSGVNQNIIPDIILFVNGLPLVVIECKSPFITNPMEAGIDQLLRYANRRTPHDDEGAEKLFHYNQMMVSTHRDKARVGTISSSMEHYLEWKDPYPFTPEQVLADNQGSGALKPDSQQVLIAGLFSKANFLDMVQNFTVFEPTDGRVVKKIARYQQFRAVHKTIVRIKSGKTRKERGGVIWHTQGSGKSLTMVFLTVKMRRDAELSQYKLVFITDRTQLDNQITATFDRTQQETVHQAKSVSHLKELLAKDSSDVVTAMVQKFQDSDDDFNFPLLNNSHKILVLADEAHRTQNGTLAMAINAALPNAPKVAFTGTPLIKSMKTNNEFGSYIDTYTIEQAVKDGATIQLLYEGREAHVGVTGDSLDSLFDEYFGDGSDEEQAAIRKKFGNKRAVLEAPQRIRRVCIDILKHYKEHIQPNGFKAMIVTSSRHAAVLYKEMMDELEAPQSAVIISGDHNDEKRFWDYTDANKHTLQIKSFLKPLGQGEGRSELSFLIVKDMLLTGFDAPIAQVMYLDRKLKDHSLLQAIARVNRTNKNKFKGYVVDYYGLSHYLTEALETFSKDDVQGALTNFNEELPKLKAAHTRLLRHFKGLGLNDLEECIFSLHDEFKRQQFQTDFQRFAKQMDIVLPNAFARPFVGDLTRIGKISHGARNLYRDESLDISGAGEKVRQLIEEHIYSTGVNPKIAPVELLAKDFKEKLNEHKSQRSRASEVEHAIKAYITINLEQDPEYYQALSKRLSEIIKQSEEKWDSLVQMLMDFRGTIESDRAQLASDLGLTETEYAFHNILMAEVGRLQDGVVDEATHQRVIAVVKSLVAMMQEATTKVDFFSKWDEVKAMEKRVKRTILSEEFGSKALVTAINERFKDLAQTKFKER